MEETKEGGFNRQAEAAVYRSAQAGCPESLDRLLRQHEGLVRQIVAHQQLCGLPFEEALQAGRIGLWRAIEGYDPQRGTRFIVYTGSNQSADSPNAAKAPDPEEPEHGKPHYGYHSLPLRLADPSRRFSLTLLDDLRPANLHEDLPAAALLLQLPQHYPDLHIDAVAGDAAFGFDLFLHTVYAGLAARRVVDCRAHATDRDHQQWVTRGYDNHGRPLCPFGYAFSSFGYDRQRARQKLACDKACLKALPPRVALPQVSYPPTECPYQAEEHRHGRVIAD